MKSLNPLISAKYRGVTLIEMMISLSMGLIVVAAIGYVYINSYQSFLTHAAQARMQESARAAFEFLQKDINMAGYLGCAPSPGSDINVLNNATDWDKNLLAQPLMGYNFTALGSTTVSATASPSYPTTVAAAVVLRGDALTVLHADNSQEIIITSSIDNPLTVNTLGTVPIAAGNILVATDASCTHTAVFQATSVSTAAKTVTHAAAGSAGACGTSGNLCTGLDFGCVSTPSTAPYICPTGKPYAFQPGSRLFQLIGVTYFIKQNPYGEPALYRQRLTTSAGAPSDVTEELIEDVQDMQLQYGVDTTGDGALDTYQTADLVTNWPGVLAIRVSLLMVSNSQNPNILTTPQTYTFNGATITATDNLLRRVYTTTIAIQNRML